MNASPAAVSSLDTPREEMFDTLVQLAGLVCSTPIAALTLVDADREWLKASIGLDAGDTALGQALCTSGPPPADLIGMSFSASVVIRAGNGARLGALCVADTEPRTLRSDQLEALELLARQVERLLRRRRRNAAAVVLSAVSAAANEAVSPADALQTALEQICTFVGWPLATAYLVDPVSSEAAVEVSWTGGHGPDVDRLAPFVALTAGLRFAPGVGLPGRVVLSEAPVWTSDLAADVGLPRAAAAADAGLRSGFAFPVLQGESVVGVLEFLAGEVQQPEEDLFTFMAEVGVVLGRAVERQRASREIQRREERLRRVIDSAGDAFVAADSSGLITEWNKRAEELLGWSRSEVLGRRLAEILIPHELRAAHEAGFARFLATRVGVILDRPIDVPALRKDGSQLQTELMVWATGEGDTVELNAFVRDITARLEVERLLRADLERKERLVEDLRGVDQIKNDVVTTVSHEFRTPLTSMLGYLELLVDDSAELDPLHRQALSAVHRNSHRLKRLVDNLVTVSRLDSGTVALLAGDVDMVGVVSDAVATVAESAEAKRITLHTELGVIPSVRGDADLLARLTSNILGNAVKFTPAGGTVSVTLQRERSFAVLRVVDTGVGIPLSEQESVFQRFYRGSVAESEAIQGSGIGLSIVREVAEAHGGSIELVSEPGRGTTLSVHIPLAPTLPGQPLAGATSAVG